MHRQGPCLGLSASSSGWWGCTLRHARITPVSRAVHCKRLGGAESCTRQRARARQTRGAHAQIAPRPRVHGLARELGACLDSLASTPGSSANTTGLSASMTGSLASRTGLSANTTGSWASTTGSSASMRGWSASTLRGARAQPVGALRGVGAVAGARHACRAQTRAQANSSAQTHHAQGRSAGLQRIRLAPCEGGPPTWARRRIRGTRRRVARAGGAVRCERAQDAGQCVIACRCCAWPCANAQ
jgi:hypothetical protein